MGLSDPPTISTDQWLRSYITIIRANWHLLPFEQLLTLLDWEAEKLAYTLREDDFLWIKLGSVKPACEPLRYTEPDDEVQEQAAVVADLTRRYFREDVTAWKTPPFSFIEDLCAEPVTLPEATGKNRFNPRFCYSYFALYGDPFLEQDPFPDGYLQRLAASGVNGVWLHAVLYKMSPFPWAPELSDQWEARLESLRAMTERAARFGIGIYLYMNEPRAMPLSFFETRPELKGVEANGYATLCTAHPDVSAYLSDAIERIATTVPKLAGVFTITASENLTNCWSHHKGDGCPRCAEKGPARTIADVNAAIASGLARANSDARLIAWDWGWAKPWAAECVSLLPETASLMSVSEWDTPIVRGGIPATVGEYALSVIGPGPRALGQWEAAKKAGLPALAKIQANTTWELGALPYIPAVANVASHIAALRDSGVSGLMLSWTLGGHPSPNLEVVQALGEVLPDGSSRSAEEALLHVAEKRFGPEAGESMTVAWTMLSQAFREFPYHGAVVYNAPLQIGPANLLWLQPTGYRATMVGLPYDDLDAWRGIYPAEIFLNQLEKVAQGFEESAQLMEVVHRVCEEGSAFAKAVADEIRLTRAAVLHYRSIAQQGNFILLRNSLAEEGEEEQRHKIRRKMRDLLEKEMEAAAALYELQRNDSRIGFEATNHYFYTPADLVEKVLNCASLEAAL
ncbi:MAG: hypothetical protein GX130_03110 [Candidatus Hydrogenedens sp.]|nr:hypothetical protein [Candidatus Hydrogenedens sp.]